MRVPKKQDTSEKTEFINHLERSSRIVNTWQSWKQSVLGGRVQEQTQSTPKHSEQDKKE